MNDQDEELQVPFLGRERKASIFDTKRTKWWSMWTFKVAITIILNFFCSILVFHIFQSVKPEHRPEELSKFHQTGSYPSTSTEMSLISNMQAILHSQKSRKNLRAA